MIKFIATDLDGTLLTNDHKLPPDFAEVLNELGKHDVIFSISSGRQYCTLKKMFDRFNDSMTIIAENGALVYNGGENIICELIDKEYVYEVLNKVREYDNIFPLFCGADCAYGEKRNEKHMSNIGVYYKSYKTVDDLYDVVEDGKILKIALFCPDGAEEHGYPKMKCFEDKLDAILAGPQWVDLMKKGVSKGTAIEQIQNIYGIKKEECAAFGDYMNDYAMMQYCGETYAMENAYPELKKVCKHICKSNDEYGVTETIKELFGL